MQVQCVDHILAMLEEGRQSLNAGSIRSFQEQLSVAWQESIALAGEHDFLGLADLLAFLVELQEQFAAEKTEFTTTELGFLLEGFATFKVFLETAEPERMASLLAYLQNPQWINPIAVEDITYLLDLLETDRQRLFTSILSTASASTTPEEEIDDSFITIDTHLLTERTILVDPELPAMIGEQCGLLQQLWQTTHQPSEALEQTLNALQPIIRATDTIQLWGCQSVLSGLSKNIAYFQEDSDLLTDETPALLEQGFAAIIAYLVDVGNQEAQTHLLDVFENPEWPFCLSEDQREFVSQLFSQIQLDKRENSTPETLTDQDLSLQIADD